MDATCFWWGNEVHATFWLRASVMFTLLVVVCVHLHVIILLTSLCTDLIPYTLTLCTHSSLVHSCGRSAIISTESYNIFTLKQFVKPSMRFAVDAS